MNKAELINIVGQQAYQDACEQLLNKDASKDTSDLPHQISDLIWDSNRPWREKIELFFDIYDDMPTYAYVMYVSINYHNFSQIDKQIWWSMARDRLASGEYTIEQPIAYSLWCDFFEGIHTVEEAWAEVSSETVQKRVLWIALVQSGPVPYPLKRRVYDRLLQNPHWHSAIFTSLFHSAFDAYGNIDRNDACELLTRLDLAPPITEHLGMLIEKIGCSNQTNE
jgi:hypothetical protein